MILARRHLLLAAAAPWFGGCALVPRPTRVPLSVIRVGGACAAQAPVLLLMLPGAYSTPQEFIDAGFVDELRQRGIAAEVAIVDAHVGYYHDKSVVARLREDVIAPARAQGYRQIWLVGISLGGFGALTYGARHGSDIDGIVALAPFLGRRTLLKPIDDAGGPRAWHAQAPAAQPDDGELQLWRWLSAPAPAGPPVWLGVGRTDRFVDTNRLLAQALPADRYFETDGGHDWPPWRALWSRWLDQKLLPRSCAA